MELNKIQNSMGFKTSVCFHCAFDLEHAKYADRRQKQGDGLETVFVGVSVEAQDARPHNDVTRGARRQPPTVNTSCSTT
jgi:hypothetical protein